MYNITIFTHENNIKCNNKKKKKNEYKGGGYFPREIELIYFLFFENQVLFVQCIVIQI